MAGRTATVELTKPITAYGEPRDTITLREPTVRDIRDCGYPFRIDDTGENFEPIAGAIARYISKLAEIPMGSVDQMTPQDFNRAMGEIIGFFVESPATSATSQGSAPPSSE